MTVTTSGITYIVEVAFATDPLAVPGVWTDVTDYVRDVAPRRGRNHELGRTQAGEISVTLDNRDRRFDPTYTSSPYYPNVVPMRHIRVRATYSAITYAVFYGFVEDWGQTWPEPAANAAGDAVISLHAVDAFKVLNLINLSSYSAGVLEDDPLGYWTLDNADGAGASATGEGSDDTRLSVAHGVLGTAAFTLPGGEEAATGDGVNGFEASAVAPAFRLTGDLTVEAWVRQASLAAATIAMDSNLTVGKPWEVTLTAAGIVEFEGDFAGTPIAFASSTGSITAAAWHHIAVTKEGSVISFYIDGVLDSTGRANGVADVAGDESVYAGYNTNATTMRLAHLAVYDKALPAERISAHLAARLGRIVSQGTGAAIGEVLDAVGWPAGLRAIDTGASTVALDPSGSALDVLQQIAEDTEHGILVMAADNKVTFIARDTLQGTVTSAATFGDSTGEVPYHDLVLTYDDQDLWTEVEASSPAGQVLVDDATAAARYGVRSLEVSTLVTTANEVGDQANGLLNRYKAPAVRPQSLTLNKAAAFPSQLGRLIGDRVTLKRRPPGGGTITTDAIIEGVRHDAGSDGWLTTTLDLAPPEPLAFWILANATYGVLGSTTRLGW